MTNLTSQGDWGVEKNKNILGARRRTKKQQTRSTCLIDKNTNFDVLDQHRVNIVHFSRLPFLLTMFYFEQWFKAWSKKKKENPLATVDSHLPRVRLEFSFWSDPLKPFLIISIIITDMIVGQCVINGTLKKKTKRDTKNRSNVTEIRLKQWRQKEETKNVYFFSRLDFCSPWIFRAVPQSDYGSYLEKTPLPNPRTPSPTISLNKQEKTMQWEKNLGCVSLASCVVRAVYRARSRFAQTRLMSFLNMFFSLFHYYYLQYKKRMALSLVWMTCLFYCSSFFVMLLSLFLQLDSERIRNTRVMKKLPNVSCFFLFYYCYGAVLISCFFLFSLNFAYKTCFGKKKKYWVENWRRWKSGGQKKDCTVFLSLNHQQRQTQLLTLSLNERFQVFFSANPTFCS